MNPKESNINNPRQVLMRAEGRSQGLCNHPKTTLKGLNIPATMRYSTLLGLLPL